MEVLPSLGNRWSTDRARGKKLGTAEEAGSCQPGQQELWVLSSWLWGLAVGSELGRDMHRRLLWKMTVVVMQNRIQRKRQERKKGFATEPLLSGAPEPGSNL